MNFFDNGYWPSSRLLSIFLGADNVQADAALTGPAWAA